MQENINPLLISPDCKNRLIAIRDTLDILNGKWKIPIIGVLSFGNAGFNQIERLIEGITPKMLSRELKDLEINELVKRTELPTKPVTVTYELTSYGKTLQEVIEKLAQWGVQHRKKIFSTIKN